MNNRVRKYFKLATKIALRKDKNNNRRDFLIGAVGLRTDGAVVVSRNLPNQDKNACNHAETLLCRKLDYGSIVFVARINRQNELCNSRPCPDCKRNLFKKGVKKVYYSIREDEFGVMSFEE